MRRLQPYAYRGGSEARGRRNIRKARRSAIARTLVALDTVTPSALHLRKAFACGGIAAVHRQRFQICHDVADLLPRERDSGHRRMGIHEPSSHEGASIFVVSRQKRQRRRGIGSPADARRRMAGDTGPIDELAARLRVSPLGGMRGQYRDGGDAGDRL